jgi:hypothetical protein
VKHPGHRPPLWDPRLTGGDLYEPHFDTPRDPALRFQGHARPIPAYIGPVPRPIFTWPERSSDSTGVSDVRPAREPRMPGWAGWALVPDEYMPSSDNLVSAVPHRSGRTRSSTLVKSAPPAAPFTIASTPTIGTDDSVSTRARRPIHNKSAAVHSAPAGNVQSATKRRRPDRPRWKGWVEVGEDFMLPDDKLVTFTPICVSRTRSGVGRSL